MIKAAVIARRLRELRGNKSREEVSAELGISISAISMYENGERIPRDDLKIKIANYYDVSVQDIFLHLNVTHSDQIEIKS